MTTTCSSISQPCETLPERYRERERRGRDGDRRRHRTAARRRRRTTDAPHVRITRASRALNLYSHARLVSQHPRLCLFRATLRSVVVVAYKNLASSMNESRFSRFSNSRRSRHTRARASPKPAPRLGTAWRRIYSIVSSRFGRRSRAERRRARAHRRSASGGEIAREIGDSSSRDARAGVIEIARATSGRWRLRLSPRARCADERGRVER